MADTNTQMQETEPLLSTSYTTDTSLAASCSHQRSPKGFTPRRCMIIPVFLCYFLAGGTFMYEVPQYTQAVMKEKYQQKAHKNHIPSDMDDFSSFQWVRPTAVSPWVPVSPIVIDTDACRTINESDPSYNEFTKVQQETAVWTIYFAVSSLVPAMFANLIWPSYSDVLGRRFAFIICLVGTVVRIGLFTLTVYFKWSLVYIIVGSIFDGITGSFTTFLALSFAYISDITDSGNQRTLVIVVFELVLGLAISASSIGMGYFIKYTGFLYPAIVCAALSFLGTVIFILFVPETMQNFSAQRRSRNMFKSLGESVKFYFCEGSKVRKAKYILLLMGFFFNGIPALSRLTLEVLYQLGRPFCWSATKIGWFGAVKTAVCSFFGIGGAYIFKKCMEDDTIAMWSMAFGVISYVVEGLAKSDLVLYSVAVISAPTGLTFPMIRSLMSCLTPADKQGAIFASVGFVETLCALVGSVSSNIVYSATLTIMNGFVFLLMAGLLFIGAGFLLAFMVVQRCCKDDTGHAVSTILVNESGSVISSMSS